MPAKKTAAKKATAKKTTAKRTTAKKTTSAKPTNEFHDRICNVIPSKDTDTDFSFESGVAAGVVERKAALPASVDLRAPWWTINDQGFTGSCVGWATADGVVRWHMEQAGKLAKHTMLSPRHVWMASKETDSIRGVPETFIEEAGTMIKNAAHIAQKYGVALESDLPFDIKTTMYTGDENTFYTRCAKHRIASYHNLKRNLDDWKSWLSQSGPILVALNVDASWDNAGSNGGKIDHFQPNTVRGGHAVAVVGYRKDGRFIVRNSWGTSWGDMGFGYVSAAYIQAAFYPESYGVTM
jgi:C1A family cysteine protease